MKRKDREGLQSIVDEGCRRLLSGNRRAVAPRYAQAAALLQLELMQGMSGRREDEMPEDEEAELLRQIEAEEKAEKAAKKKAEKDAKKAEKEAKEKAEKDKGKSFEIDLQE